jgi:outer membrane protein OmpA-like peptidoglycan-associated protein
VKSFLISNKVNEKNIFIEGFNFERPAASNSNEEGRARNRRVEISLDDTQEQKMKSQKQKTIPKKK